MNLRFSRRLVHNVVFVLMLWTESSEAGGFTFPTDLDKRFIVGDQINVTWDVVTPRISLYERCGTENWILTLNTTNKYSYVWTANRDIYIESGCHFELASLTSQGEPYGHSNATSVTFGVAKRYHDDPSPTSYHFASKTATSLTGTSTATVTTTSSTPTTAIATTTDLPALFPSAAPSSGGLSSAAKIGIGLGVPLGIILLAAGVGLFIFSRRRKRARTTSPEASEPVWNHDGSASLPGGFAGGINSNKNIRGSHTDTIISELSSENYRTRDEGQAHEINELMGVERSELSS
ncbi:hypothetical protein BDV23DRAFT_162485 [Aspergillus alliaceus]|uniref:Mid2 domain-containing protein n=1 Tax=Petromyces alliaceus TaxID=209559 RepID=A0A5N7BY76_PETAA|nr:hypothetical protein BDV23DRAFT_162485 [Aspergillus alliaceus]